MPESLNLHVEAIVRSDIRAAEDHRNIRILQMIISEHPPDLALEPDVRLFSSFPHAYPKEPRHAHLAYQAPMLPIRPQEPLMNGP